MFAFGYIRTSSFVGCLKQWRLVMKEQHLGPKLGVKVAMKSTPSPFIKGISLPLLPQFGLQKVNNIRQSIDSLLVMTWTSSGHHKGRKLAAAGRLVQPMYQLQGTWCFLLPSLPSPLSPLPSPLSPISEFEDLPPPLH